MTPMQTASHSPKRQKLDRLGNDAIIRDGHHSYLTLAQVNVVVAMEPVKNGFLGLNPKSDDSLSIVSVSKHDECLSIEVTASSTKLRITLTTEINDKVATILKDCVQTESLSKIHSQSGQAPLAGYVAVLHVHEEFATLTVKILWLDTSEAQNRFNPLLHKILVRYSQGEDQRDPADSQEPWDVGEFYNNVHVPQVNAEDVQGIKIDLLHCELYPFQRRAVKWLLSREGVSVLPTGRTELKPGAADGLHLPVGFHQSNDAHGLLYFTNPAIGVACSSRNEIVSRYSSVKGGLLGEAMGLGKTVEMLALMCLHNMATSPCSVSQPQHLRKSGATLIITPPTILEQWKQEIQSHAPSLRVYHYKGVKASTRKEKLDVVDQFCDHDVVLTTYSVISKELYYVMERPDRSMRKRPRFEPPKSPLDQVLWWRVCLDEAQMIETGVSAAATVARLIPRVNAWAVTGTPIKQWHRDLYGLLLFLRYEPWCNSPKLWDYLVSYHRPLFRQLMAEMAIRHSKEVVREELRLPSQNRHTISISFTNIEQAHYAQLFHDMYQAVGLNSDGSPTADEWDPDSPKTVEKMRNWLTRLRQTCLHPEVGGRNRRALGRNNGPLRTVAQVLDVMIDQTETTLRAEQRTMLMHKIRRGQILENAKHREQALKTYSDAYKEVSNIVDALRKALEAETGLSKSSERGEVSHSIQKMDSSADEIEEENDDSPLLAARQRLRSALEVKHVCIFFMANIYYQLKSVEPEVSPESEEFVNLEMKETKAYDEAKLIRAELLQEVVRRTNKRVAKIKANELQQTSVKIPAMSLDLDYTGIESRKIYEKLYKFCESMNLQAEQMNALREKMLQFLQQALIDEDEGIELQGDEYENSTKHQDEMYAYMEALRALFADRSDAVTGQENLLIRSEMKSFQKAAKEGEGPAPELMLKLLAEREQKRIHVDVQGSLRGIVAELRALVSSLQWSDAAGHSSRAKAEMHVAEQMLQHATRLMSIQSKALTDLESEVGQFRNSMNARLEYYKGLQKISDTVAPYREEDIGQPLDQAQLDKSSREEASARSRCSAMLAKSRYLLYLKGESSSGGAERVCTICQSEFEMGTITSCGHVFCKDDIQLWYREHGNCPVCKQRLRAGDFFDITYKPSEMAVQVQEMDTSDQPTSSAERSIAANSIYSDIAGKQLNEIKDVELRGPSFGSKVDTICRHLHWLREKDPGSKTLVFSQFREVLDVLGRAFRQSEITFSKCDDIGAIEGFKSNPAIEVFLLHAKAHSAGLNLVVASHVILCEPLINTALELQAIARVHRIGQHRTTSVWMYLIADTVEESIYDISVKRRLAHMRTRNDALESNAKSTAWLQESTIDAANSKELQAADLSKALAPGRNGGEMVDKDDLWPCLFSKPASKNVRTDFLGAPAEAVGADSNVGRFLRAEAAERRRNL